MTPEGLADELDADRDERIVAAGDWDDVETLWHATEAHAEAQRRTDTDETNLSEHWGSLPVGLIHLADWHIGSRWVDYRALREFADELAAWRTRHPQALKVAFLGDGTDGYMPGMGRVSAGMFEETETSLDRQDAMFVHIANRAGGIDYLTLGCHWAWSLNAGRNPLKTIAPLVGARDMGFGYYIDATVGQQQYHLIGRHRASGISRLNTSNQHRNIYQLYEMPGAERADVVALAHLHINNLHRQKYAGKEVVWLSAGGAKAGDCYARQIGVRHTKMPSDFGAPLVVLYPDTKRMVPFYGQDWRLGLTFLAYERARYAAMPDGAPL
jgi:hypothetical protein